MHVHVLVSVPENGKFFVRGTFTFTFTSTFTGWNRRIFLFSQGLSLGSILILAP